MKVQVTVIVKDPVVTEPETRCAGHTGALRRPGGGARIGYDVRRPVSIAAMLDPVATAVSVFGVAHKRIAMFESDPLGRPSTGPTMVTNRPEPAVSARQERSIAANGSHP